MIKSPLRYPSGKSRAVKTITKILILKSNVIKMRKFYFKNLKLQDKI